MDITKIALCGVVVLLWMTIGAVLAQFVQTSDWMFLLVGAVAAGVGVPWTLRVGELF